MDPRGPRPRAGRGAADTTPDWGDATSPQFDTLHDGPAPDATAPAGTPSPLGRRDRSHTDHDGTPVALGRAPTPATPAPSRDDAPTVRDSLAPLAPAPATLPLGTPSPLAAAPAAPAVPPAAPAAPALSTALPPRSGLAWSPSSPPTVHAPSLLPKPPSRAPLVAALAVLAALALVVLTYAALAAR